MYIYIYTHIYKYIYVNVLMYSLYVVFRNTTKTNGRWVAYTGMCIHIYIYTWMHIYM